MTGWHHRCNRHELGQTLGGDGQGGLACCSPWGHKESYWVTKQQQELINLVVVSGEQRRDSAIHTHVSIFPQTLLPSC